MKHRPKRVVVAMSGGVDSSVAAAILKEKGYDVIGITMNLLPEKGKELCESERSCCGLSAVEDARRVAAQLNIPYYVVNFKDLFRKKVIDNFVAEYEKGRTPNPCVKCNEILKFDALLSKALQLGADYIATGHYARVKKIGKRYVLLKGKDKAKDQTYFLYSLSQKALAKTMFPLGALTKPQVRALAKKYNLKVAEKAESQEICFVEGPLSAFFDPKPGDIVDINGKVIGRHKGYQLYTIGQRKGIGIAGPEALYVTKIDPRNNKITVGRRGDVLGDDLIASNINLITIPKLIRNMPVKVKIRYRTPDARAIISRYKAKNIKVTFSKPQFAITPGQSVVFYDKEKVVGGGIIEKKV